MNSVIAILLRVDFWEIEGAPPLRLELVEMRHAKALERFEIENREFFAQHVGDRGDDYFEQFERRLRTLVDCRSRRDAW